MRQYCITFGILLFSIIGFAPAAPIPVQEDLQASVGVPRDMVTVVEKRGSDDIVEKLTAYFDKWADPPASSPPGSGHEPIGDTQTPSSLSMGTGHESTSDAHTSSLPLPGLEREPINDEQASGPTPEPAPSIANPNPSVETPNLSTEPSKYSPVLTVPSSYTTSDYGSGSDEESVGSHASQLSYPSDWDYFLNPQNHPNQEDHVYLPDSPPPPPPPQQQNGFAHGDDEHQTPQQNGIVHGQTNDAASTGSSTHYDTTLTSSDDVSTRTQELDAMLTAYEEWLSAIEAGHPHPGLPWPPPQGFVYGTQMDHVQQPQLSQEHDVSHGSQMDNVLQSPPSQQNGFTHGIQMDNVVPTDTTSHTPTSTENGRDHGSLGTRGLQQDLSSAEGDYWPNPDDSVYYDIYPQLPPSSPT